MIGVFDSGNGGLTIFQELTARLPHVPFVYLGDHANAPYGNRTPQEIVRLTRSGVQQLYDQGCKLVILACNTATAVAGRTLQQDWLPNSPYRETHNVLGIIAPTVEVATQTPWATQQPQYPQALNTDTIAVFGTVQTVASNVYVEEIQKRCPQVNVVQQACPHLAGAIEQGASEYELNELVEDYVQQLLTRTVHQKPHWAILGCTHFPWVRHLFERHLPPTTRVLCQPTIIAKSLQFYLERHPQYLEMHPSVTPLLLTTGATRQVSPILRRYWPEAPEIQQIRRA